MQQCEWCGNGCFGSCKTWNMLCVMAFFVGLYEECYYERYLEGFKDGVNSGSLGNEYA